MESDDIQLLPNTETEAGTVTEPGRFALILDRGWSLGKKIAITGVAISSAAVVLPPLMLFSALGLAFSIPFGLVFAGYACTDKIMRSLLSSDPVGDDAAAAPPSKEELYTMSLSDEMTPSEEKGDEDVDDVREIVEDYPTRVGVGAEEDLEYDKEELINVEMKEQATDDVDQIADGEEIRQDEEEEEAEDMREIVEDSRALEKDDEIGYEKKHSTKTEEKKQMTDDVEEIKEGEQVRQDEEEAEEKGSGENLMETNEGSRSGLDVRETKDDIQVEEREEKEREITLDGEGRVIVGEVRGDEVQKGEDNVMGTTKEREYDVQEMKTDEEVREGENNVDVGVMKKDEEVQEGNVKEVAETDDVKVLSNVAPLKDESSDHERGEKRADSIEHSDSTSSKPSNGVASEMKTLGSPIEEGLYTEEKLWEQIDAVRTIVGYNAALHTSYIEELKALYLFTGVEPPATFTDPSDLAEVYDKLRFLKSVVGVK